ncbi:MAG: hypothetical protein AAF611_02710 [Bacteroidota bacterium]
MKKLVLLCVLVGTFFSCDDGDLTIEEIDLTTTANVETCTTPVQVGVTFLFKINSAETLILQVPESLLINEVTTVEENEAGEMVPVPRTAELNNDASCLYRSFESAITSSYFCDDLPSDVPINLEYAAVSGIVEVITTEEMDTETMTVTGYNHQIDFTNVVFTGTNGQDVRYGVFEFGDITTSVE